MKNKGFTLVELLAAISVLGIIAIVAMVSINNMIDESKITECENVLLSIKNAAKEYVSDNRFTKTAAQLKSISLSNLVSGGYLTESFKDPFTNNSISASSLNLVVKLTLYTDMSVKSVDSIVNSAGKTVICEDPTDTTEVRFPG